MQQISEKRVHDWVGKVIHLELCKKLKFPHTTKWHVYKPESILENETHKFLCDFNMQTDYQIPARRLDPELINKKKEFVVWRILPFE